ncbi:MAG: metal-dependent hydrolase [Anaerolineaceae bacterium]|nr:metal-dependent hydrolase [Anaerolineaceae bacterium]
MAVVLTWYGHAVLNLDVNGIQVLVDPFLKGNPAATITPDQVNPQFILVSHGHGDHVGDTLAIAERTGATVISNAEIVDWAEGHGVKHTHAQHIGGGFHYPFGYLKLTQAQHGSALPDGSNGGNPVGFLLTTPESEKLYLAGDTGLFGDMRLIGEESLDLAVLPIGDNYTMGPDDALRAVKLLQPRHVIPIHFSTYDMITQDPLAWKRKVEAETSTQVHVLKPGESFNL